MAEYDTRIRVNTEINTDQMSKLDILNKKKQDSINNQSKLNKLQENANAKNQDLVKLLEQQRSITEQMNQLKAAGVGEGHEEYDALAVSLEKVNNQIKDQRKGFHGALGAARKFFEALKKGSKSSTEVMGALKKKITIIALAIVALGSKMILNMVSAMKEGFKNLAKYSTDYNQAMSDFKSRTAELKNNLAAAFAPIVTMALPYLTRLMAALNSASEKIAQFFAVLAGKSTYTRAKKQAIDYAKTLDSAGKAAGATLAAFDDINVLQKNDETEVAGTGAAAGGEATGAAAFEEVEIDESKFTWVTWLRDNLEDILPYVEDIGAGFLAWKLSSAFIGDLTMVIGIAAAVAGGFEMIKNAIDAWQNGASWQNLGGMVLGAAVLIGGLALAFGAVGAAVGLVIAGITFLVVGIHDIMENGVNLKNGIMVVMGVVMTLLGTVGAVGVAIGGIVAGLVLAIVADWDNFKQTVWEPMKQFGEILKKQIMSRIEGLKEIFSGFMDFFKGVFTGDWKLALEGIKKIFSGAVKTISGFGKEAIDGIKKMLSGFMDFFKGVFTGNWRLAWQGIKKIFTGALEAMLGFGKNIANIGIGIVNTVINAITGAINAVVRAINKISFTVPDWVPGIGGSEVGFNIPTMDAKNIPYLAQGAVIPPRHPFLAMLGDQQHGTNIEAPLSTIEEGLQNVFDRNSQAQNINLVLRCNGDMSALVRLLVPYIEAENSRVGVNFSVG